MKKKRAKILASHGRRGDRVRVFVTPNGELARVQHHLHGRIVHTRSWPATKEGKAEAEAYAETYYATRSLATVKPRSDLTLLEVWQAFSTSEFPHLRTNSKRLYEENFAYWMLIYGEHFLISRTTLADDGAVPRAAREGGPEGQAARRADGAGDRAVGEDRLPVGQAKRAHRRESARRLRLQDREGQAAGLAARVPRL
jgi:hypothetical protein